MSNNPFEDIGYSQHPARKIDKKISSIKVFRESFNWIPHSKSEATLAVNGLRSVIKNKHNHQLATIEQACKQAKSYNLNSRYMMTILNEAKDNHSYDLEQIRNTSMFYKNIAEYQLYKEAYENDKWPIHNHNNFNKKLLTFQSSLYVLADQELNSLCSDAYSNHQQRATFWQNELSKVADEPRIIEFMHEK